MSATAGARKPTGVTKLVDGLRVHLVYIRGGKPTRPANTKKTAAPDKFAILFVLTSGEGIRSFLSRGRPVGGAIPGPL